MADTALAAPLRSPLSHVADRLSAATRTSGGAIRLAELSFLAQINVRLDAKGAAAEAVGLALDESRTPVTATAHTTTPPHPGTPKLHPHGLPRPGRTLVMGVVNITPDSFSDGGLSFAADAAVAHGLALVEQGADIVDVGGESTRPGAARPPVEEELRRVLPVVRELVAAGAVVSVDTMRAEVAARALDAGARLINDVSGGLADPAMLPLMARAVTPCHHCAERPVAQGVRAVVRLACGGPFSSGHGRISPDSPSGG